jgi:hypothetical protein
VTLEALPSVARMRDIIRSYPPVLTVVSEQGRGEDATDPTARSSPNSSCRSSRPTGRRA